LEHICQQSTVGVDSFSFRLKQEESVNTRFAWPRVESGPLREEGRICHTFAIGRLWVLTPLAFESSKRRALRVSLGSPTAATAATITWQTSDAEMSDSVALCFLFVFALVLELGTRESAIDEDTKGVINHAHLPLVGCGC
jgi:hypothetical protein